MHSQGTICPFYKISFSINDEKGRGCSRFSPFVKGPYGGTIYRLGPFSFDVLFILARGNWVQEGKPVKHVTKATDKTTRRRLVVKLLS